MYPLPAPEVTRFFRGVLAFRRLDTIDNLPVVHLDDSLTTSVIGKEVAVGRWPELRVAGHRLGLA